MLCAHTVRRLKPGTFDRFMAAFRPEGDDLPAGWVGASMRFEPSPTKTRS
jgi:hypothetical protein